MTHQPSNPVDSNKLSQDFAVQAQELIISRQRYYSTSSIFVLTPSLGYLLLLVKLGLEPLEISAGSARESETSELKIHIRKRTSTIVHCMPEVNNGTTKR